MFRQLGRAGRVVSGLRFSSAYKHADYGYKHDFTSSKSFAVGLFTGELHAEQCFPYPRALTEEQEETLKLLVDPATKFFREVNNAAKNDELETVEAKSVQGLQAMGAFGMQVPVEYGGVGLTNTQYARVVEIVGAHDLGVGIMLGAHQSIGYKGILLYGNEEQKRKYLPDLASGKKMAAYCLTEPSSGSDAQSIRSRAVLSADGSHYILNGSKIWISNGGIAEVFTVFAQTQTKVPATGETRDKITAFIVERGFGGLTSGKPEKKMGIKCSNTAELHFDNIKVPRENVLGGVGNGFKVAMNILNAGRFGMAAALSGTMRSCIAKAVEHASQRVQFGKKIYQYEDVQSKLTQMALRHYATESMAYSIAANMDRGAKEFQLEAAISKIYGSESAWSCADTAIQVLGGMGFMKETGLEKVLRDIRIFRIFEGANDILRLFVALTGMQSAGAHLKSIQKQVSSGNVNVLLDQVGRRTKRFIGQPDHPTLSSDLYHSSLGTAAEQLQVAVGLFGETIEKLLLRYGKHVTDKQSALIRVADAAMDIYGMAVVISRATEAAQTRLGSADVELLMANMFCQEAFDRVRQSLSVATSRKHAHQASQAAQISDAIVAHGGLPTINPLGF